MTPPERKPQRSTPMTAEAAAVFELPPGLEAVLRKRLKWLEDKSAMQRDPSNSDYTPSPLLQGRTQGQIGEIRWILRQAGCDVESKALRLNTRYAPAGEVY